jgi:hypothetical protein
MRPNISDTKEVSIETKADLCKTFVFRWEIHIINLKGYYDSKFCIQNEDLLRFTGSQFSNDQFVEPEKADMILTRM